jgi:hypothetical protein
MLAKRAEIFASVCPIYAATPCKQKCHSTIPIPQHPHFGHGDTQKTLRDFISLIPQDDKLKEAQKSLEVDEMGKTR